MCEQGEIRKLAGELMDDETAKILKTMGNKDVYTTSRIKRLCEIAGQSPYVEFRWSWERNAASRSSWVHIAFEVSDHLVEMIPECNCPPGVGGQDDCPVHWR